MKHWVGDMGRTLDDVMMALPDERRRAVEERAEELCVTERKRAIGSLLPSQGGMMFKKAMCFTDIHYGKSNNGKVHNEDCRDFVTWILAEREANGAETCIFLGDWHDNRNQIHLDTLNHSLSDMERLCQAFTDVYILVGNHDLFYRDKRDISSVAIGRNLPNLHLISEPTVIGDTLLCPWLVGDEWKSVRKTSARYVFGHFELPNFLLNAGVAMPDHGGLNLDHLAGPEYVFSGHFHKRQHIANVHYIGNCFPHNFSDAGDDARGYMLLEHGGKPQYVNWLDCPKYRTTTLSALLDNPEKFLMAKTTVRVTIDIEISFEEAQLIRDSFQTEFQVRKVEFLPKAPDAVHAFTDEVTFQSVDQIVAVGIGEIDTKMDKQLLMDIYRGL